MIIRGVLLCAGCVLGFCSTPNLFRNKNLDGVKIGLGGVLLKFSILYVCAKRRSLAHPHSVMYKIINLVAHQYFLEQKQGSCVLFFSSTR